MSALGRRPGEASLGAAAGRPGAESSGDRRAATSEELGSGSDLPGPTVSMLPARPLVGDDCSGCTVTSTLNAAIPGIWAVGRRSINGDDPDGMQESLWSASSGSLSGSLTTIIESSSHTAPAGEASASTNNVAAGQGVTLAAGKASGVVAAGSTTIHLAGDTELERPGARTALSTDLLSMKSGSSLGRFTMGASGELATGITAVRGGPSESGVYSADCSSVSTSASN